MREVVYTLPPIAERSSIGAEWATRNGLDPANATTLGVNHDWIHAAFNCGPNCEGIVFAVEESIEAGILFDADTFFDDCVNMMVKEDSYGLREIEHAYSMLVSLAN